MSTSEKFRRVYLPYCLIQVEGKGHVVVNRLYKPLGVHDPAWVEYEPHAVQLDGLTPAKAKALSWDQSEDLERVYLYNDGCKPEATAQHWQAYQKRLALLAKLRFSW